MVSKYLKKFLRNQYQLEAEQHHDCYNYTE